MNATTYLLSRLNVCVRGTAGLTRAAVGAIGFGLPRLWVSVRRAAESRCQRGRAEQQPSISGSESSAGGRSQQWTEWPPLSVRPAGSLRGSSSSDYRNISLVRIIRSEERRVGKESRSRWSPY